MSLFKIGFLKDFAINYIHRVEILVILTIVLFVLYIFYSLNLFKKQ